MTGKADFTEDEWEQVLTGPPTAGMIVITADHGGMFRETFAMSKAYAEARKAHGESELLDAIVSAKPEIDHTRYASPQELRSHGLERLSAAVRILAAKAAPEEIEGYRNFILGLAEKVAGAHKEHGATVSDAERSAISEIAGALGSPAA